MTIWLCTCWLLNDSIWIPSSSDKDSWKIYSWQSLLGAWFPKASTGITLLQLFTDNCNDCTRTIITCSWILTIHKDRILWKTFLEKTFLTSKKWVKNLQTSGYNGAHMLIIFGYSQNFKNTIWIDGPLGQAMFHNCTDSSYAAT